MALVVIEHSQNRESLSDGPSPKAWLKVVGGQKRAGKMRGTVMGSPIERS